VKARSFTGLAVGNPDGFHVEIQLVAIVQRFLRASAWKKAGPMQQSHLHFSGVMQWRRNRLASCCPHARIDARDRRKAASPISSMKKGRRYRQCDPWPMAKERVTVT